MSWTKRITLRISFAHHLIKLTNILNIIEAHASCSCLRVHLKKDITLALYLDYITLHWTVTEILIDLFNYVWFELQLNNNTTTKSTTCLPNLFQLWNTYIWRGCRTYKMTISVVTSGIFYIHWLTITIYSWAWTTWRHVQRCFVWTLLDFVLLVGVFSSNTIFNSILFVQVTSSTLIKILGKGICLLENHLIVLQRTQVFSCWLLDQFHVGKT